MTQAAAPAASPAGLSFVVSSLRGSFGFSESEAVALAKRHSFVQADIAAWVAYLETLAADGKVGNPKAYAAALIRQYKLPPTTSAAGTPKKCFVAPVVQKAQGLWRRQAWRTDKAGRKWWFQEWGLFCAEVGWVAYSELSGDMERLVGEGVWDTK